MGTISRNARFPLGRRFASTGRRPLNGRRGGLVAWLGSLAVAVTDLLYLWQQRLRDRDMLRNMSTTQLKDIGLSRADALNEAEKPFWRS